MISDWQVTIPCLAMLGMMMVIIIIIIFITIITIVIIFIIIILILYIRDWQEDPMLDDSWHDDDGDTDMLGLVCDRYK